ncbi:hypothetical protein [Streptacidiphilus sp. EB103A]|uniref:hypothetical protein n=1 Tax=Streptacidiphilus sp. EB103A TaxID=3156275 RepID=UPI0035180E3F
MRVDPVRLLARQRATATGEPHSVALREVLAQQPGTPLIAAATHDQAVFETQVLTRWLERLTAEQPWPVLAATARPQELRLRVDPDQLALLLDALLRHGDAPSPLPALQVAQARQALRLTQSPGTLIVLSHLTRDVLASVRELARDLDPGGDGRRRRPAAAVERAALAREHDRLAPCAWQGSALLRRPALITPGRDRRIAPVPGPYLVLDHLGEPYLPWAAGEVPEVCRPTDGVFAVPVVRRGLETAVWEELAYFAAEDMVIGAAAVYAVVDPGLLSPEARGKLKPGITAAVVPAGQGHAVLDGHPDGRPGDPALSVADRDRAAGWLLPLDVLNVLGLSSTDAWRLHGAPHGDLWRTPPDPAASARGIYDGSSTIDLWNHCAGARVSDAVMAVVTASRDVDTSAITAVLADRDGTCYPVAWNHTFVSAEDPSEEQDLLGALACCLLGVEPPTVPDARHAWFALWLHRLQVLERPATAALLAPYKPTALSAAHPMTSASDWDEIRATAQRPPTTPWPLTQADAAWAHPEALLQLLHHRCDSAHVLAITAAADSLPHETLADVLLTATDLGLPLPPVPNTQPAQPKTGPAAPDQAAELDLLLALARPHANPRALFAALHRPAFHCALADQVEQHAAHTEDPAGLDRALNFLDQHATSSHRAVAALLRGRAAEGRGDAATARRRILQALDLDPELRPALCDEAEYAACAGEYDRAALLLEQGRHPLRPGLLRELGTLGRPPKRPSGTQSHKKPCACGSGRTYKSCHGAAPDRHPLIERAHLIHHLAIAYMQRPRFQRPLDELRTPLTRIHQDAAGYDPTTVAADLLLFEHGRIKDFLSARGPLLADDERDQLDSWADSRRLLWEVRAIDPGVSVELRTMPESASVTLADRILSGSVRRLDLLFARLLPTPGDSGHALYSMPIAVPRDVRSEFVHALGRETADLVECTTAVSVPLRRHALNEDDEPMVDCWVRFEVPDPDGFDERVHALVLDPPRERVARWLAEQPEAFWLATDQQEVSWVRQHEDGRLRVLGRLLQVDATMWEATANSCRRLDAMTEHLRVLAPKARLLGRGSEDHQHDPSTRPIPADVAPPAPVSLETFIVLEDVGRTSDNVTSEITSAVEREILETPFLGGGLTPAQAVAVGGEALQELLQCLDDMEWAGNRPTGFAATLPDPDRISRALGIKRT